MTSPSEHQSHNEDSHRSSVSESESGEEESAIPVESLVSGRERRANAGNRMSTLLDQEEEDELTLLFEETGVDEEFEGSEADNQSDAQLDSSSEDEDDKGPAAGDGDLDGEKELQRQSREERQRKKRKFQANIYKAPGMRKKVKIDPMAAVESSSGVPAPRPKKKVDRLAWSQGDDAQLRSSTRKSTVQNKQVVQERMKDYEERRKKQIASMEAAAAKKEKVKKQPLTYEERMAEAARVEKVNTKNLSRWQEDEKKREEERKAKLAALHSRQMKGPVITTWSGVAKWTNGTFVGAGKIVRERQDNDQSIESTTNQPTDAANKSTLDHPKPDSPNMSRVDENGHLRIRELSSLTSQAGETESSDATLILTHPSGQPLHEYSTRNLITLSNCTPDNLDETDPLRQLYARSKRAAASVIVKPQKPIPQYCVITGERAKYRDPETLLPYASAFAFQEIQRLKANDFKWSDLLGCFVGPDQEPAHGVPDIFLTGSVNASVVEDTGDVRNRGRGRGRGRGRARGRG